MLSTYTTTQRHVIRNLGFCHAQNILSQTCSVRHRASVSQSSVRHRASVSQSAVRHRASVSQSSVKHRASVSQSCVRHRASAKWRLLKIKRICPENMIFCSDRRLNIFHFSSEICNYLINDLFQIVNVMLLVQHFFVRHFKQLNDYC